MYDVKVKPENTEWLSLDFSGVTMKILFKDEKNGAMTVITKMKAGAVIPAHFHTHADESVFILDGDFIEDNESFTKESYFVGKAGNPHGPHRTANGCTLLTHFSAELDFQLV